MTENQKKLADEMYGEKLRSMNDNQCRNILKHMMEHGSITQAEAIDNFGCYRLSARIADLRHEDVKITTIMAENVHNSGYHGKYILEVGA